MPPSRDSAPSLPALPCLLPPLARGSGRPGRRDSSSADPSEVTSNGPLLTSRFSYMAFNIGLQHLLNVYVPSPVLGALPMNDSRGRYD